MTVEDTSPSSPTAGPLRLPLGPPCIALLRMSADEKVEWLCTTLNGPSSQSEVNDGFQFTAIVRLGTPNNESSGAIAVIRKKRWP